MLEPVFTPETIAELRKPLDDKTVKHRQGGGGSDLKYLAGYQVIDTANRIFGEGNWGYDLLGVELNNVLSSNGEIIGGYYSARVKVTVKNCVPVTDEGVCAIQDGRNNRAIIDGHDMARKGAITDAMKRAFRCFGNQFGNPLYDKDYGHPPATENRSQQPTTQATRPAVTQLAPQTVNRTIPAPSQPQAVKPAQPVAPAPRPVTQNGTTSAPIAAPALDKATDQQREGILRIAGRRGMEEIELNSRLREIYGYGLSELTKSDAGHFIKVLQEQA
jgi:DNA recombination protein Rad52